MEPKILSRDANTCSFSHYSCTFETCFLCFILQCLHSWWAQEKSLKTHAHHGTHPTANISQPGEVSWEFTFTFRNHWPSWAEQEPLRAAAVPLIPACGAVLGPVLCLVGRGKHTSASTALSNHLLLLMCLSSHHSDMELKVRNWGTKSQVRFWKDCEWIDTLSPF